MSHAHTYYLPLLDRHAKCIMNVPRAAYTADHSSNTAFGQLLFSGLTPLQKAAPPLKHYDSLGFLEAYVRDNYRH